MEEDKKNKTEQIKNTEFDKIETVGNILKQKRKELKLSLDDVSSYLKIKKFYLEAIENNDFNSLPGNTYVIGFIKSYASFLKLDQKMLVELYKYINNTFVDDKRGSEQNENVVIKDPVINTNHLILILFLVLFVLIIIAIIKFSTRSEDNDIKPTENIELLLNNEKKDDNNLKSDNEKELLLDNDKKTNLNITEKIDENNLKVSDDIKKELEINKIQNNKQNDKKIEKEEQEQQDTIEVFKEYGVKDRNTSKIVLKVTKDNWIKLKKDGLYKYDEKLGDIGDGITIFEGVLKSGDIYYIPDEAGYYLTIGNAQGIDIIVGGKIIEPLSKYEVSRHNIEMDVEKLLNKTAYKRN